MTTNLEYLIQSFHIGAESIILVCFTCVSAFLMFLYAIKDFWRPAKTKSRIISSIFYSFGAAANIGIFFYGWFYTCVYAAEIPFFKPLMWINLSFTLCLVLRFLLMIHETNAKSTVLRMFYYAGIVESCLLVGFINQHLIAFLLSSLPVLLFATILVHIHGHIERRVLNL